MLVYTQITRTPAASAQVRRAALASSLPHDSWRDINRRVPREKAVWLECKAGRLARHHREILDSRHVKETKRVPQDDILVVYAPILDGPRRQAPPYPLQSVTRALHGKIPRGPSLVISVRCYPQGFRRELAPRGDSALCTRHERRVCGAEGLRKELVRDRLPIHWICGRRVLHNPGPRRALRRVSLGLLFGHERGVLRSEGISVGVYVVGLVLRDGDDVDLLHRVLVAVDRHVQPRAEHMLRTGRRSAGKGTRRLKAA